MNSATENTPAPASPKTLTVTPKALSEVKRLIAADSSTEDSHLRVMVVGGGCSGMSYKLGFEKTPIGASDKVFEFDGVKVVCDSKSFLYIAGTELDFSDGLNGTGFTFNNPNAKRTCGCGSSFSA
jgi:iron-sulfur cluster assembly protein